MVYCITWHCPQCCLQVLSTRARKEVALADVKVQVRPQQRLHMYMPPAISAVRNPSSWRFQWHFIAHVAMLHSSGGVS